MALALPYEGQELPEEGLNLLDQLASETDYFQHFQDTQAMSPLLAGYGSFVTMQSLCYLS